jgi:hypothetical protein
VGSATDSDGAKPPSTEAGPVLPDPWFAELQGEVVLYRVNRRPPIKSNLFTAEQPDSFLDHLVEALPFGEPYVTGRKTKRDWRLGNRHILADETALTGQIGWTRQDARSVDYYDEDTHQWEDQFAPSDATARAPFAIDGATRVLGVLKHPTFSEITVGKVFEGLLQRGEVAQGEARTDWAVEPILDEREFRDWLASVDAVHRLTMVAKLPNPDPLPDFEPLWSYLEERKARLRREVLESKDDTGLRGIAQDETVRQVVAMGRRGFGYIAADGVRDGKETRYDQRVSGARERTDSLPSSWADVALAVLQLMRKRQEM